eukprot:3938219-Rhodomonas_salina.1
MLMTRIMMMMVVNATQSEPRIESRHRVDQGCYSVVTFHSFPHLASNSLSHPASSGFPSQAETPPEIKYKKP